MIALDFDFSSPQNPRDDAALEGALHAAKNVLLISYLTPERKSTPSGQSAAMVLRTTTPLDRFDQYTPDLALAYIPLDSDERARRYPFQAVINGSNVGSLAVLAAASYEKLLDGDENKSYGQILETKRWPSLADGVLDVPVTASRSGQTKSGQERSDAPVIFSTPLDFWGPQKTFATYSYADVLNEYSPAQMRAKFGGKIVFVGVTAHILKDVFPIPPFTKTGKGDAMEDTDLNELPGVEIHATATAMLLDGTFIHVQSTRQMLWTLLLFTLGASLWAASLRGVVSSLARRAQVLWTHAKWPGQIHTTLWFALYLILGALPIYGFWVYANFAFQTQRLWVVVAYPLLSASAASGS